MAAPSMRPHTLPPRTIHVLGTQLRIQHGMSRVAQLAAPLCGLDSGTGSCAEWTLGGPSPAPCRAAQKFRGWGGEGRVRHL